MLGFLWIVPELGDGWMNYVPPFLLIFILMATTLRLLRMRRPYNMAVLGVILVLWFAYIIRFFIINMNPNSVNFLVPELAWESFDAQTIRQTSFSYLSTAFCAFCVSVIFFWAASDIWRGLHPKAKTERIGVNKKASSFGFIVLAFLALVLLNTIYLSYGIGKMGTFVEKPLPFKLTGAIIYTKSVVVPCLFVLYIYRARKNGRLVLARLGVLVLLLSGIFDMFVYKSRGALLLQIILIVSVWLLAGFKLYKFDKLVLTVGLIGCLLVIPIVTAERHGSPLAPLSIKQLIEGFYFVFFRITGIDQFMVILHLGKPIPIENLWSVLSSPRGVAGYYTTQLLNYGVDIPQTFAPSMLGWLYLIGGLPGIIGGSALMGFLATYVWNSLGSIYSRSAPVVKSYFLIYFLGTVTEGFSKVMIISFIIVAILLWYIEKSPHIRRIQPPAN